MTDEACFLNAIRAEPDEDGPRLMFADWLDETGKHTRAEFIRLQCYLATMDSEFQPLDLLSRAAFLEQCGAHGFHYLNELGTFRCRRGFPAEGFLRELEPSKLEAFLSAAPFENLQTPADTQAYALFGHFPEAALLHGLTLVDPEERAFRALMRATNFRNLRNLRLRGMRFDDVRYFGELLQALCRSPLWGKLRRLALLGWLPDAIGMRLLMRSEGFRSLQSLEIATLEGLDEVFLELADAGSTESLREVTLSQARGAFPRENAALAADWPGWENVRRLRLACGYFTRAGLSNLLSTPTLDRLQSLTLSGEMIGNAELGLASGKPLPGLERLAVLTYVVEPCAFAVLSESGRFPNLRTLRLEVGASTRPREPGTPMAHRLAAGPLLTNVEELHLVGVLNGAGIEALAARKDLDKLRGLNLSGCALSDRLLLELAQAPWLPQLRWLKLPLADFSPTGLQRFLSRGDFDNLRWLGVPQFLLNRRGTPRSLFGESRLSSQCRLAVDQVGVFDLARLRGE